MDGRSEETIPGAALVATLKPLGLIILLSLLLQGCLAPPPTALPWRDQRIDLAWPPPPQTPRIRFLRSIDASLGQEEERKSEIFLAWLTGEKGKVLPLVSPYGVAADGAGRIWVADIGIQALHVYDLADEKISYWTTAGSGSLVSPVGVALDLSRERLFVADSVAAKVYVYTLRGKYLTAWEPPGGFSRPGGLATDAAGNLYVVDVLKASVEVFSPAGNHLRTLTSGLPPDYRFNRPTAVAVDAQGRIFVCDAMNFRVEVFGPDGKTLRGIGQVGDVPGSFARPRGIAVDSDGHVYVVDAAFENVQIFDAEGRLLLNLGGPGEGPGQFSLPSGIFIDREDRIYISDPQNQRIQVFQYLPEGQPTR